MSRNNADMGYRSAIVTRRNKQPIKGNIMMERLRERSSQKKN